MSEEGASLERDSGEPALRARKSRDAALILPLAGLLLISPPMLAIFSRDDGVFGGALVAVYLFSIWAVLIFCAFRLARRLKNEIDPGSGREGASRAGDQGGQA